MINKKIRDKLVEFGAYVEKPISVLENHTYDNSIVGVTFDGRVIYDYDLMIQEYAKDENVDLLDAKDWVDTNTVRALSVEGSENKPIILYRFFEESDKETKDGEKD